MNREPAPAPTTLLVHNSELTDVRTLLDELGTPFVERRGPLCPEDRDAPWGLVIGTPRRILRLGLDPSRRPALIAIVDEDSRTLRNSLRRADIRLVVRRPFHRAALRAVILHTLYRGPEKRRSARVSVGAPVRYRKGWRRRTAILADLSLGGCRILTPHAVEVGDRLTVQLPADLTGGRSLSAQARVLRCGKAAGEPEGTRAITARFEAVSPRLHAKLKRAVASHASGPATFEAAGDAPALLPSRPAPAAEPAPSPRAETAAARDLGSGAALGSTASADTSPDGSRAAEPAAPPGDAPMPCGERRQAPRHALEQRENALGDEASRVLMGREISIGGMRVDPNPHLRVGEDLRLAIHIGDRETPLVLAARVHRDDRERGVVLRFHELSAEATRYLNDIVGALPLVDPERGEGMLVTEILEGA